MYAIQQPNDLNKLRKPLKPELRQVSAEIVIANLTPIANAAAKVNNLVDFKALWDIPIMTVIIDDKRRVTLPRSCHPGERFDIATDSAGRIILRKLEPTPREIEKIPIVHPARRKRLLVAPTPPKKAIDYASIARLERDEQ